MKANWRIVIVVVFFQVENSISHREQFNTLMAFLPLLHCANMVPITQNKENQSLKEKAFALILSHLIVAPSQTQ